MKAVRYHSYGDSDVLVYEEADRPVAGPGQVVVQVAGTSFNPVDAAIRAGLLQQVFPVVLPHVPNFDVAGVIAEVGEGVSGWSVGDAVVAFLPMTAPGAAAETSPRPPRRWPPPRARASWPTPRHCPRPGWRPGSRCSTTPG